MKTQETTQPAGEKALIEQIATLQKQLGECLEDQKNNHEKAADRSDANLIIWDMENIVAGAMGLPGDCSPSTWRVLRDKLMNDKKISHFFNNALFRDGLSIINQIIDKSEIAWRGKKESQQDYSFGANDDSDENHKYFWSYAQTIPKIILGVDNHESINDSPRHFAAFRQIKAAFDLIPPTYFDSVYNYFHLKIALDCILWCQRYMIVLVAGLPEEKEDQE